MGSLVLSFAHLKRRTAILDHFRTDVLSSKAYRAQAYLSSNENNENQLECVNSISKHKKKDATTRIGHTHSHVHGVDDRDGPLDY